MSSLMLVHAGDEIAFLMFVCPPRFGIYFYRRQSNFRGDQELPRTEKNIF